jgi:hypothetical protein
MSTESRLQRTATRRWAYLDLAARAVFNGRHVLTGEEFRMLYTLAGYADIDLSSSFPSVQQLCAHGWPLRMVQRHLASLISKNWLARAHADDAFQFLVPADASLPRGFRGPNGALKTYEKYVPDVQKVRFMRTKSTR